MIVIAGVLILGVYVFATFGILASLKLTDLSIVTGIADAMKLSFHSVIKGQNWLYDTFMVVLLFTFFGNMVTWSVGANHSMGSTGLDRTAPGVFGHVNRRFLTPDYAFVLWGVRKRWVDVAEDAGRSLVEAGGTPIEWLARSTRSPCCR